MRDRAGTRFSGRGVERDADTPPLKKAYIMDGDSPKRFKRQHPNTILTYTAMGDRSLYQLPQRLDQLEWVARHEFVPRLESIIRVMLDEQGALTVKRASPADCPGVVLIDLTFGREETTDGHWTAFLVRVELDPQRNMVCVQAGSRLHMNRQFSFGEEGWDIRLIECFEWMLSDSMRPHLRVRDLPAAS